MKTQKRHSKCLHCHEPGTSWQGAEMLTAGLRPFELRTVRNNWAHQRPFSTDDAYRAGREFLFFSRRTFALGRENAGFDQRAMPRALRRPLSFKSLGRPKRFCLPCAPMQRIAATLLALVLSASAAFLQGAEAPEGAWIIESRDGAEFNFESGIATATNGVVVRYGDVVLTAKRAVINQFTGEVQAEGDVRIQQANHLWQGASVRYNLRTGEMAGRGFRTGQPPFLAGGSVVAGDHEAGVYVGRNAFVTTDDYERPGYRVRAETLVVVPGEYITAKNALLYLGNTPVFYFPYYRRSLEHRPNRFSFTPGYRSAHGPFLLTAYEWYWSERLDGAIHLDARLKRGIGLGPDLNWHLPRWGEGTFKYYYLNDDRPGEDENGNAIDDDRQRIYFSHRVDIRSNLVAKAMVRYQSDSRIIRDFFESEYRDNVQPNSYAELEKQWDNWNLNLLVQARVNDFFETVERLPDLKLTGLPQQIGNSPFYYESESTFGYYRRKFADDATDRFSAVRGDTFHQVLLPKTFFGWLNVTPRAGGRLTHYGETHGPGTTMDDQGRAVFNTGAEVSWKASRLWQGVRSSFWDIDGLRHIIQPSLNYSFVPRPTERPPELPQFDYEVPTTRLLPITFPDFNAIDAIDSQNVVRLGLRNKLQTKRQGTLDHVVDWALYADWRLDPRGGQGRFSDLYSDMDLRPFAWLTLNSETRYDLNGGRLNEANHYAALTPNDIWSLTLGHRYLREFPGLGPESGNNTFFSRRGVD